MKNGWTNVGNGCTHNTKSTSVAIRLAEYYTLYGMDSMDMHFAGLWSSASIFFFHPPDPGLISDLPPIDPKLSTSEIWFDWRKVWVDTDWRMFWEGINVTQLAIAVGKHSCQPLVDAHCSRDDPSNRTCYYRERHTEYSTYQRNEKSGSLPQSILRDFKWYSKLNWKLGSDMRISGSSHLVIPGKPYRSVLLA